MQLLHILGGNDYWRGMHGVRAVGLELQHTAAALLLSDRTLRKACDAAAATVEEFQRKMVSTIIQQSSAAAATGCDTRIDDIMTLLVATVEAGQFPTKRPEFTVLVNKIAEELESSFAPFFDLLAAALEHPNAPSVIKESELQFNAKDGAQGETFAKVKRVFCAARAAEVVALYSIKDRWNQPSLLPSTMIGAESLDKLLALRHSHDYGWFHGGVGGRGEECRCDEGVMSDDDE